MTITGETTGVIKTLVSGTSQYGNNLNCGWVINGGTGNRIQMLIGGVDLQSAPVYTSCGGYDNLSIKDGNVIYKCTMKYVWTILYYTSAGLSVRVCRHPSVDRMVLVQ